jgi:hypothetical protein
VTQAENMQNRKGATVLSKTGVRGVTLCPDTKRFRVVVDGKHVGRYDTIAEAELAAIEARNKVYTNNLADWQSPLDQLARDWNDDRAVATSSPANATYRTATTEVINSEGESK